MKSPALILIDLDGVIVNSFEIHVQGWLAIMQLLGYRRSRNLCTDIRGVPTREALSLVLQRLGLAVDEETFEKLLSVKMAVRDLMVKMLSPQDVIRGVTRFLHEARNGGTKTVCMATTTAALEIIDRTGTRYLFDEVVYGGQMVPPKNLNVQCLSRIICKVGTNETNTLLIDDSFQVTHLAASSGIPSIWISGKGKAPKGALRISSLQRKSVNDTWSKAKHALCELRG
jgi:beta-phosphoglucomutase